jgi:lipopolysaccharide export system protein LptC
MNTPVSTRGLVRSERHARTAAALVPSITGARRFGARYSRFVGTMKVLLPLTAAAIAGLILAWPGVHDEPQEIALTFAETNSTDAETPGMANARYVGTDANNRPFLVTADEALQDPGKPDLVDLVALQADMTLDNGVWMSVMASSGQYDRAQQTLQLAGPVNIFSDAGYEFHTESARIDLQNNIAESDQPVRGHGPFGTLSADSFRVIDQGQRLLFRKNVRMIIRPFGDG